MGIVVVAGSTSEATIVVLEAVAGLGAFGIDAEHARFVAVERNRLAVALYIGPTTEFRRRYIM